jgi:hypothetical protein
MPRDKVRTLPPSSPEIPRSPSAPVRSIALVAVLLVAIVFFGAYLRTSWSPTSATSASVREPAPEETAAPTGASSPAAARVYLHVDDASRLLRVAGADLRGVLGAMCGEEFQTRDLLPYAIAPSPAGAQERIGVLRNRQLERFESVVIRLDPGNARWTIGDGKSPIAPLPIADVPRGALSVY